MVAGAAAGELVDRGAGPFTLAEMQVWGAERTVRAAVLRYLLVAAPWPVHAKGVRLRGVRISGHLDLEAATLRCPLSLECCYLDADKPTCLDHATASLIALNECELPGLTGEMLTARGLDLSGSTLTGPLVLLNADIAGGLGCHGARLTGRDKDGYALYAAGIKARSGVFLTGRFTAAGAVCLFRADITGGLVCSGARLNGRDKDGYALYAAGIKADDVLLGKGFTAAGAVCLEGGDIADRLGCGGARLTGRDSDGSALFADGMKVGGDVFLDRGFTAAGTVRLLGAEITGQLGCRGAQLNGTDSDGNALVADGMKVSGGVFLEKGFTAAGAVRLVGAEITGQLICSGAKLNGTDSDGSALFADGMKVSGDVFLDKGFNKGFTAAGAIRLRDAEITGRLDCSGAKLNGTDSDGNALDADGMKVGRGVFLNGFAGAVRLVGADITGQLGCRGARLAGTDSDGNALTADGMKVSDDVFLDGGFTAAGTISLDSVHVGGSVFLTPTALADENKVTLNLNAPGAQIAGTLEWAPAAPVSGQVNLEGATVGELIDDWSDERADANGYWPSGGRLKLDGFTYGRFGVGPQATVKQRLDWIQSQYWHSDTGRHGYATQPYEQLATVYRKAGQDDEARKVAIARRADPRKYVHLNRYRKFGNWFLDWSIKYGYRAWRAGVGLAAVFVIFAALSFLAQQHHLMVPVGDTESLHYQPSATQCTSSYPCFYPVGYAIDTVIPIINVHQAAYWGPDGHTPLGHVWVASTWVATGLGWALATLLVAGYTGLVRRD